MGDITNLGKAGLHHRHVRFDNCITEAAEFVLVLVENDFQELIIGDIVVLQEGGDPESGAEEGIPLHTVLEIFPVGRLLGDIKAVEDIDLYVLVYDLLSQVLGDALPYPCIVGLRRLPDEGAAFSAIPFRGLVWVNALGSQQRTTLT